MVLGNAKITDSYQELFCRRCYTYDCRYERKRERLECEDYCLSAYPPLFSASLHDMKLQPGRSRLRDDSNIRSVENKCGEKCFRHELEIMIQQLGENAAMDEQYAFLMNRLSDEAPPPLVPPPLGPHCS